MWLCNNPHGAVLVHRVYPSICDCPAARHSLPHDGHHAIKRGIPYVHMHFNYIPL